LSPENQADLGTLPAVKPSSSARAPVIAGVGQLTQRVEPTAALEPVDLMAEAARRADGDAGGSRSLLRAVELVAVVNILSWRHPDPGVALAGRLGLDGVRTLHTTIGGNSPQLLLNELGAEIAAGRLRAALVAGAEAMHTRRRRERPIPWLDGDGVAPAPLCGDPRPGWSPEESAHHAALAIQVYPLFETAVRAAAGRSLEEHSRRVAELWSGFSAVAATRPEAWSRTPWSADDIRLPGPGNRMVTFPYTKRMCANLDVDQAAAVLLCSAEAAREAGVPAERLVYLHAGADAVDHFLVSERSSLARSPAIATVGAEVLAAAGIGVDDVARFDLYSCFPSAVEVAMDALRLGGPAAGDSRPLTLTGGLAFFGGPGSNYVTHSVAAVVEACRADPGSYGMVTGVGWFLTKHSAGLYSTRPPAGGFVRVDPASTRAAVERIPKRAPAGPYAGAAEVEATAVQFGREGDPALGVLTALTPSGARAWATTPDAGVLASMTTEEWAGRRVRLRIDGATNSLDA
jgi:acetyl-CoA C-acetyltransferase